MPDKSNNPFKFWEELKRRRVIRVITVYAAAAFVLLELVDIISEPFGLPDWTLKLVTVLLVIGFIISIILSWIYDVTPEGIEKTKSSKEVASVEAPPASIGWKIATFVSVLIIIAFVIFYIVGNNKKSFDISKLDKSIAVLPFINDSPDNENVHIINGIMEAVLDNLCKIEDLRVVSRTSVEQYRNNPKPIPEIGKEMNVGYILEGSGQKYGDNIRLTLQLLDARNDKHLWSSPYNREIVMEQIFDLQSEIAELVAAEIEAVIKPEEKQLIEKEPTTSLTAYDLYQKGRELQLHKLSGTERSEVAATVQSLYRRALQYDSTFAQAYVGLAGICLSKFSWDPYLFEPMIDSVLIYSNLALSYDDQLADAYIGKGHYYNVRTETNLAIREWEKAISLSPNAAEPYRAMGWLYNSMGDYVKSIESFVKASSLNRGPELPSILYGLGFELTQIGFYTESIEQSKEKLKLDGDSISYFSNLSYAEYCAGHYDRAIGAGQKAISRDPQNHAWSIVGSSYLELKQYEEALYYLRNSAEILESMGQVNFYYMPALAFAYLQMGDTEKSGFYLKEQITLANDWIDRRISGYQENYLRLAQVYAIGGETGKAMEKLRLLSKLGNTSVHVNKMRNSPMMDNIRNEPGFDEIMDELEAKYQAEHERVRKWLEENDML